MLKILGRLSVIILVTVLLAAGLYALVQVTSQSSSALAPGTQIEGQTTGTRPAPPEGFDREGGEKGEFSLTRGLGGVAVTLVKFGVVTMLVLALQKLLSKTPRTVRPA
jgi:hypothetical protein